MFLEGLVCVTLSCMPNLEVVLQTKVHIIRGIKDIYCGLSGLNVGFCIYEDVMHLVFCLLHLHIYAFCIC